MYIYFSPEDKNPDYIVFKNLGGFLNTCLLTDKLSQTFICFDTIEVEEKHQGKGYANDLIKQALAYWGEKPEKIYMSAWSDEARYLQKKYKLSENIRPIFI